MEYWSHGGTKNIRLGPSFSGILVPGTNFSGTNFPVTVCLYLTVLSQIILN